MAFRILGDNASKGIKGVEVPTGDLTFDLEYSMKRNNLSDGESTDISNNISLYNYKYNSDASYCLGDPNNTIDDFPSTTFFSKGVYPYSHYGDKRKVVYQNGNLSMVDDGKGTIHVTISDYATSDEFPDRTDWGAYGDESQYTYAKNNGFISVGIFYMQVDMNDETCKEDTQSYIEIEAKNAKVHTVGSSTDKEEIYLGNNKITANHIIYGSGQYGKEVHFFNSDDIYLANPWGAGNSSAYVGSKIYIQNRLRIEADNDKKDWIYGVDGLLKFDDTAFEPIVENNGEEYYATGEYGTCNMKFNILYAGKKDKTGWISDKEMIDTSMEDLVYFDTISELENAGYTCVAVMMESTSGVIKSGINAQVKIPMRIKSTAKINEVAQAVLDVRYYNEGNAPNRETQTHTKTTTKSDYPPVRQSFEHFEYIKTAYDENGQMISGTHGGGYIYGNSLLILGADQSVKIKTLDDSEKDKTNYDVGKNETETTISIAPALTVRTVLEEKLTNISIRIESKLPKGLKYVPGSSNYDEPNVVNNEDGTTTLTWEIYNCVAGENIEPIAYKAHINEETPNGEQYTINAIISEITKEGEEAKIGNKSLEYRTATSTIQIINLSSYSLYKATETPIIEINGLMHYKVVAINKTDDPITDFQLLDILPYNGDNRGTNFNGSVTAEKIEVSQINSLTSEKIDNSNLNIYISNQESVRTGVTAKDENLGKTDIWNTITSGTNINSEVTAYSIIGKIAPRTRLEIDIYLQTNGNKPSDIYKNSASAQINKETEAMETPVIIVQDVKRLLSGKVWLDANKDGVINDGEELLSNVTVTLINEDGTPAIDNSGNVIQSTKTNSNGEYSFEDMVRANYKIKVDITDSEKEITIKNAGTNQEINSKFNNDQMTDIITELNSIASPVISQNYLNAGITYKDTSVTVHHYIKDTTTKLSEDVTINGKIADDYDTTEAKDIPEYYELVSEPLNKKGKMTKEAIEVIYYYQLKKYPYTVNYLEKTTNKKLNNSKKITDITYGTTIKSENEVINIDGYNYDSADIENLTISTSENVINLYYTKRNNLSYTVNYLEKGTNNKIINSKQVDNVTFETIINTSDVKEEIYGYDYDSADKSELIIGTGENVINIYYIKKSSKVIVHYYEEGTTNKLSEDITINGKVKDTYETTSANDILPKYELVKEPENKTGEMTESPIEVIYYYRVKDATLKVRYLEKGTEKELATPEFKNGKVDDDYETTMKDIDGYQWVETDGNSKGKLTIEPTTVTYYYLYKTKAKVEYIDKITGKILEQSETEGLEGDEFVTENKDFENYILIEEPAEKTIRMTKDEQILRYYYVHVSGGVIEKHIDIVSGEILANEQHQGKEGDEYNISSRTFEKYDLVEEKLPTNSKGKMSIEPIEVIYYYRYKSKVTAEYIDKITQEKLTEDIIQNGHEEDNYQTERKKFDDYKLIEVPQNADGKMTKEDIKVTYYYVHTSGGVIVNHIDIKTNKQLRDESKIEGYEGDDYETHKEEFDGYDLVTEKYPSNANGKMTIDTIKVTYYYIKKAEVNVKYIDKETGEEIEEPTNIKGHEDDEYNTEPKEIPGYDLIKEPENKSGTMTTDQAEVIYYYKRPAKVIVNYYDIDTKEKIAEEIQIEGHQNDEYTTEEKEIKYYKIEKIPENKEGRMIVTITKDENDKEIVEDTTYVNYYYRKLTFNLKIEKIVDSISVNGIENKINGNLGKIEINKKKILTSNIRIKYKIKVSNDSELSGKAQIIENIPRGMKMKLEDNYGWNIQEENAIMDTEEIKPGESVEYIVTLEWINTENEIGTKVNIAQLENTENEANFEEKDKTDNKDEANVIISIDTGDESYKQIAIELLLLLIELILITYILRKVIKK